MLIGLTGLAGAGKSEVARVLMGGFGFRRIKFADPLKSMLRTMLRDIGHTDEDVERYVEGDLKEAVVDGIGVTARHLMQTLGTEWGRKAVGDDLWVRLWAAKAELFPLVIADDVRFENEVDAIRARGGKIWHIKRPGLVAGDHESERLAFTPDRTILNTGTLAALRNAVALAAEADVAA